MRIFLVIPLAFLAIEVNLYSAEAGMPQLDSKYWASQAFWLTLIFTILYLFISKIFIPKIKNGLDNRDNKIKDDLDEAKNFNDLSEKKLEDYEKIIDEAKKQVKKILSESKDKLIQDIDIKKKQINKEIEEEVFKAQAEILELKKNSINNILSISEEISSEIIEKISGDKLNGSSIKATVLEISKNNLAKLI
jgi:F-type H+-transporting ATPase subunit b|tara:strand:+ start:170 stop:745 length:576 start_codon:yes stop_codon:yes gene_type:complete